jgi:predicted choloylglycine hydrolase
MQAEKRGRQIKRLFYFLAGLLALVLVLLVCFKIIVRIEPPEIPGTGISELKRIKTGANAYKIGNNWVRKSSSGLWEMYLSGTPYELGLKNGILNRELISFQEKAFVERIKELIPSEGYLRFLRYALAWFNKDLDRYVPIENQQEIFGVSQSADPDFKFIADNYERILNYHAAHDIGHAMQNLNLVGCTSFGVWDEFSMDSSLLIGRNFDFYAGDEFAENKIVALYHPDEGIDFVMITWAGMTGVVSGMNREGLTVTLNAAKSEIPFGARTPVSIVARRILQYASDIPEAIDIASSMETFVCETFLIGSARDGYAALIEKTPDTTVLYKSPKHFIIATNHLQHPAFSKQAENKENMADETSVSRFNRVEELLREYRQLDFLSASTLLRDQRGPEGKNIGMGNEKAINQLICHHSVIFKPAEKLMWVSVPPFQLGRYVCYDLKRIFSLAETYDCQGDLVTDSLTIPADPFLTSREFRDFLEFKKDLDLLKKNPSQYPPVDVDHFISLNPEFFTAYESAGDYFSQSGGMEKAAYFYNFALSKEVSSASERKRIMNKLSKLKSDTRHRETQ